VTEVPPDSEVVARVLSGDLDSFEFLMRRYNQRLFRLARSVLKDDAEAEDVVQETYVRAYAALKGFEFRSSVATWLSRIALYEALGRKRRREAGASVDVEELQDDSMSHGPREPSTPEQHAADTELRPALEAAIDALPVAFRSVFVMRAVEELSTQETAEALEILPETVKTRFFRAREMLRRDLVARIDALSPQAYPFLGDRCNRIVAAVLARISRES
jgi:RNA polymerase sigma-70 factor, ECF subfamily